MIHMLVLGTLVTVNFGCPLGVQFLKLPQAFGILCEKTDLGTSGTVGCKAHCIFYNRAACGLRGIKIYINPFSASL
jgi:hypothetical protein